MEGYVATLTDLLESVHSSHQISGYTHNFYRYPARFSPQFVRAAIDAFTKPGDTVLDPFMGGGTTAIEALVSGRKFIGCDLNPLATFITRVKTTPISQKDIDALSIWGDSLPKLIRSSKCMAEADHYLLNVPWWVRELLRGALASVTSLTTKRQQEFARSSLLKTGQWALDCRAVLPRSEKFLAMHRRNLDLMLTGAARFRAKARETLGKGSAPITRHRRLLTRSASGLDKDRRLPRSWLPPRLVLTSPPYPGVHIVYHRWQVRGRRETPLPYWLAGGTDGHGSAFYTFGDRRRKGYDWYMRQLRACFQSVASVLDRRSLIIQLVAFSDPQKQLPAFLDAMSSAGLVEVEFNSLPSDRIWRAVPNRKWYASQKGLISSSREAVLFFKKGC